VKSLVVLIGTGVPISGVVLDLPFVLGASWLWPLCRAGLPQGSASGNSRESFLIARVLWDELDAGAGGGVVGRWGGFAASSPTPGIAVDVVDRLGNLGSGRSAIYQLNSSGSQLVESTDFFFSHQHCLA
jgi:hypothetical protein